MGHSNQNATVRIYARWMPQADLDAGGQAVEKFASDMLRFCVDSGMKSKGSDGD
ncbi:hypothetical protein [Paraburkholderia sp.]|uniref:hypothetical protein n=1 Tax=Paraburkholderia sp. TaxID=1926495 RepID=UPI0025FA41FD|nr:hypothetical protein [Paraburkholderia sp.]